MTSDELREKFLRHLLALVAYWHRADGVTPRERLEGLVHSILATIDGVAVGMPSYELRVERGPSLHLSMVTMADTLLHDEWGKLLKDKDPTCS